MPKNVAQAKCTKKTNAPSGHIPLTPLPRPKPAAQSGSNNSYASNALGRYGLSSDRTNEMVRIMAPTVRANRSGTHSLLCMKASVKVRDSSGRTRDAKPASKPLPKMSKELRSKAAIVCAKSLPEAAMIESDIPIHGVSKGATKMPKINRACALKK